MSSYSDIIKQINNKFETDTIDISPFFTKGEEWLYSVLKKTKQEVYPPDYRLVLHFINDRYTYQDHPGDLAYTLQKCIAKLDISVFFVVLITESDISDNLKRARQLLKTDKTNLYDIDSDVNITYYTACDLPSLVDVSNVTTQNAPNTTCQRLWDHVHINVNGDVLACCASNHNYVFGNVTTEHITDIIKSHRANKVRKIMLNGNKPETCRYCYELEDQGLKSLRKPLSNDYIKTLNKDGSLPDDTFPTSLDIRISNLCNLKCRMCTGTYSSKIASEEKNTFNVEYSTILYNNIKYPKGILDLLSNAKSIYFAGGEPLLMKSHYVILDKLLELNNKDIEITYNTNFTTLFYKGKSVIDYWKKFNNVTVGASLDAMDKHIEYIRNGTVWSEIIENYNALQQSSTNVTFNITSIINIYNAFNLIKSQQFWIKNGLLPESHRVSILTKPDYLSIQVLPMLFKKQINDIINKHILFLKDFDNSNSLIDQWREIQKFMFSSNKTMLLDSFFEHTRRLDQLRGENFETIFTEYETLKNFV